MPANNKGPRKTVLNHRLARSLVVRPCDNQAVQFYVGVYLLFNSYDEETSVQLAVYIAHY